MAAREAKARGSSEGGSGSGWVRIVGSARGGPRGPARGSLVLAKQVVELRAGRAFSAGGSSDLARVQRSRILSAAAEVVGEVGYAGMSVARVTGRAGVSRRTFYDLFDDREDCFMAVFEEVVDRASAIAQSAVSGQSGWREQARAGLTGLLEFAGDERVLGTLVVVHALGCGPNVLSCRTRRLGPLIAFIDEGRSQTKTGHGPPPPLTAEGIVGAVLSVIHARMLERESEKSLIDLLNPLMGMIVLPYLGPTAAAQELSRPTPKARHTSTGPVKDPLNGLDMRLTYRTLRVLAAIADQPGASNREVADRAEVQDQGQISKLLARLDHLGLIQNTGHGHAKGEANAWTLTPRGQNVEQATRIKG